ncbi:MAG: DNA recombination protein RmuC [Alphaproteobacteria bacterium]|nr:DNA recombination protein RmuC [Alphaproteobacteria bacterium]
MPLSFGLLELSLLGLGLLVLVIAVLTLDLRRTEEGEPEEAGEAALREQLQALVSAQHDLAGRLSQLSQSNTHQSSQLTQLLDARLDQVSQRLNTHVSESAEKTSQSLSDLAARLAVIDEAQRAMAALGQDVVGLQDILSNKQARGAFGEIQLEDIVKMALAPDAFRFQATLSNRARVDCLVTLPAPPGPIAIDAKFPLEAYAAMRQASDDSQRDQAARQFRIAVLKHASDIKERYIVPGETAESALMFLPSEAIYAELHANFTDVVQRAHALKVYIVSPTTLMATLHTMRAVMKDARMHAQAGIIQREVGRLADDVRRLKDRAQKLEQHFDLAQRDLRDLMTSADKLTRAADRITEVELESEDGDAPRIPALDVPQRDTPTQRQALG